MLYYTCPTCGTELGKRQIPYENMIKNIQANSKLSFEQKEQKKSDALNTVGAKNPCCRMRLLTYIKKVEIVK